MELLQARVSVIKAGKKLLESGLITRTWGNVSCRINDLQFVITPSGRAYESLSPDEIVLVKINDGSYSGEIKPSSEKDLHAEIYKQRKDVNFIIHTHQEHASALSPLGVDIPVQDLDLAFSIGNSVACAAYGLPGSQKLKKEAIAALARSESKAILLANHGAVCLGEDMEEAFQVASDLEKACIDYTCRQYLDISGGDKEEQAPDEDALRECYLSKFTAKALPSEMSDEGRLKNLFNSERNGDSIILYSGSNETEPFSGAVNCSNEIKINKPAGENEEARFFPEAELHREIYRRYKEFGAVIHTTLPDILAVSKTGRKVFPLLDDFAQIIGTSIGVVEYGGTPESARKVAAGLKGRSAVLIKGKGALCCGPNRYDVSAAVLVLAKNCKALISSSLIGKVKPINPLEALIMRFIYLKKYSKKI